MNIYLIVDLIIGFGLIWGGVETLIKLKNEVLSLAFDGVGAGDFRRIATQFVAAAVLLWFGNSVLVHKFVLAAYLVNL
ncbi:hypothetical protein ACPV5R_18545 [Vibrio astriarenae]